MDVIYLSVADDASNPKLKEGTASTGVPVLPIYISEAAEIGYSIPFLEALLGKKIKEGEDIDTTLLANAVDRKLKVFVEGKEYNGKISNQAKEFKAL